MHIPTLVLTARCLPLAEPPFACTKPGHWFFFFPPCLIFFAPTPGERWAALGYDPQGFVLGWEREFLPLLAAEVGGGSPTCTHPRLSLGHPRLCPIPPARAGGRDCSGLSEGQIQPSLVSSSSFGRINLRGQKLALCLEVCLYITMSLSMFCAMYFFLCVARKVICSVWVFFFCLTAKERLCKKFTPINCAS